MIPINVKYVVISIVVGLLFFYSNPKTIQRFAQPAGIPSPTIQTVQVTQVYLTNIHNLQQDSICDIFHDYLIQIGASAYEATILTRIAKLESQCTPSAVNSHNGITGILQFTYDTFYNQLHCDQYGAYDSYTAQGQCGLKLLRQSGLHPWQVTWNW